MSVDFRIPEIETERLRLRLPVASDLDAHLTFRASERSAGVGGPFDAASSFHHLAAVVGQWQLRGYGRWMVSDRHTDQPLGLVGIYHPLEWPEPEIGWSVYEASEGRGVAYEAALAVRSFVFATLGWNRIVSLITADNQRSVRLAERLGCMKEGIFEHPEYGPLDVWLHPGPEASS